MVTEINRHTVLSSQLHKPPDLNSCALTICTKNLQMAQQDVVQIHYQVYWTSTQEDLQLCLPGSGWFWIEDSWNFYYPLQM